MFEFIGIVVTALFFAPFLLEFDFTTIFGGLGL